MPVPERKFDLNIFNAGFIKLIIVRCVPCGYRAAANAGGVSWMAGTFRRLPRQCKEMTAKNTALRALERLA